MGVRSQHDGYLWECEGIALGAKASPYITERADKEPGQQVPTSWFSPYLELLANGRASKCEEPAVVYAALPPSPRESALPPPQGQAQLTAIQQQVKWQVMKQQAQAIQQGKVPTTKVTIQMPGYVGRKTKVGASQSEGPGP